jgi:CubicO group peptidase (beta-lactamase class C family)
MFDINRFGHKINNQLAGRAVGYQYVIYDGAALTKANAGGFAVRSPAVAMTADRRMTTTSMTKTITAAAFMRALEIHNQQGPTITIDTGIEPYLPASWALGPHVSQMTFKDLLTHESGLRSVADEDLFDSLRQTIANGSTDANWHQYAYQNSNYSMFRVLIPNILYGRGVSAEPDRRALLAERAALQAELATASPAEKPAIAAQIKAVNDKLAKLESAELHTAKLYVKFVQQSVFGPIGLGGVGLAPTGPQEAIEYYNFTDPSKIGHGQDYQFYLLRVGAGHWFMSSNEFGKFIANLRNGAIVSANSFQLMVDNSIGLGVDNSTVGGPNWNHNGGFADGGGAGMQGDWMALPNGMTAVILANSVGGITKSLENVIRNAYNAAFLNPPTTSVPSTATTVGSVMTVAMRGDDGHVYVNPATDGQPFGGWLEVEGGATVAASTVAAASLGQTVYLVARGWDDRVHVNTAPGQPFTGWQDVAGGMVTDAAPAAASFAGRMYLFAKGLDGRVYVNSAADGQPFGNWREVEGGQLTDTGPAAAALGSRIYVFSKGANDGKVYVNSALAGKPFDGWGNGWSVLPGTVTDASPAAASLADHLYVFAKDPTNRIRVNQAQDGAAFVGWHEVEGGGATDRALGAAALGGRIYVFAKGVNDNRIYVNSAALGQPFDGWGNGWAEVHW